MGDEAGVMDTYQRVAHHEIYRNPWVVAEVHEIVHPTGVAGEHLLVAPPRASAVVVRDGDEFIFTRQARFAAQAEIIEIVKGGADADETALACAQRELCEELGYIARTWRSIGRIWEIPSIVAPAVELFEASELSRVATTQEENERITEVRMTRSQIERAVCDQTLCDAVTLAALVRITPGFFSSK